MVATLHGNHNKRPYHHNIRTAPRILHYMDQKQAQSPLQAAFNGSGWVCNSMKQGSKDPANTKP